MIGAAVLDLHRLRLLHELAERGTLAAVAEALSYSPSTVSQQLATLEREAGATLLVPAGRRVQLTPQGRALAEAAAELLALEERARAQLEAGATELAPVRVAVFPSAAQGILPHALTLLQREHPQLRVSVAEVPPEEGLSELSARGFDLAIAEQYPGHTREHRDGLVRTVIGGDPIRLAVPPASGAAAPAAAATGSELAGWRDHPWVMEPGGTAARSWTVQQCRAAGFEPEVRFESADLTAHVRLIAAGHAVGMLPDLIWAGVEPPVALHPLPGHPRREIFTATRESAVDRIGVRAVQHALEESFREQLR